MQEWKLVATDPPPRRIRVIGAKAGFVIGDVFYGDASMQLNRMGDPKYVAERNEEAWRYSQGEDKVKQHLQPTHWIDLPDAPMEGA